MTADFNYMTFTVFDISDFNLFIGVFYKLNA